MVTIYTASLTFNNSTFCPHTVFMCFVWIWEQTAIISLYNINWLVFYNRDAVCLLRGTDWVFNCNAGNSHLNPVSLPFLTADACVKSKVSTSEICGGQSRTVRGFVPALQFSPASNFPPILHSSPSYAPGKRRSIGYPRALDSKEVSSLCSIQGSALALRHHLAVSADVASCAGKTETWLLTGSGAKVSGC